MPRWGLLGGSAACALAVASCGGHDAAVGSSPLPVTSTAAAVTTPPPSLLRTATTANPRNTMAVLQGVTSWAQALTTASQTASPTPVMSQATAACSCLQGAEETTTYLSAHHLHLTVQYRVVKEAVTAESNIQATVLASIANSAYAVEDGDGTVVKREPAALLTNYFSLELVGDKWLVAVIY
jgi:hypothetical protein